jgi:hypothetical protein
MTDAIERAVAEYREAYPENDDLPDSGVANLLVVRQRALGIALQDFGRSLGAAWSEQLRRFPFLRR